MTRLLNIDELAAQIRLAKSSIYRMVSEKRIPHLKISSRLLFDEAEINEWMKKKRIPEKSNG